MVRLAEANGAMQDGILDLAKIGLRLRYYVFKVILLEPFLQRQEHGYRGSHVKHIRQGLLLKCQEATPLGHTLVARPYQHHKQAPLVLLQRMQVQGAR